MRKPTVHRRSEGLCRTDSHMCARNTNTPKQVKNRIRTPNIHTHFHKHCNPSNNTLLHGPTDCVCCLRVGSVVDPPQGFGCSVITHNHCHTLRFDCECIVCGCPRAYVSRSGKQWQQRHLFNPRNRYFFQIIMFAVKRAKRNI